MEDKKSQKRPSSPCLFLPKELSTKSYSGDVEEKKRQEKAARDREKKKHQDEVSSKARNSTVFPMEQTEQWDMYATNTISCSVKHSQHNNAFLEKGLKKLEKQLKQ